MPSFLRMACALALLAALLVSAPARATALDVFGNLPLHDDMTLSPDGTRIAFLENRQEARLIRVVTVPDFRKLAELRLGSEKIRRLRWADNDNLTIVTSTTLDAASAERDKIELYKLLVLNVIADKTVLVPDLDVLRYTRRPIYLMKAIAGDVVVRRVDGHTVLFVPGWYMKPMPRKLLFRVDLHDGTQEIAKLGNSQFDEWLLDGDGRIVAERSYDQDLLNWNVRILSSTGWRSMSSGKEAIDVPSLQGFGVDPGTLLMVMRENGRYEWKVYSIADGHLAPALPEQQHGSDPIEDKLTHRTMGFSWTEDDMHYVFFDKAMRANWDAVRHLFDGAHLILLSLSDDHTKALIRVEDPARGFSYQLVDLETQKAMPVGEVYAGLDLPLASKRITYAAPDGLAIPAYLTLPRGRNPQGLPLVVLPHGGPAARDTADFDWFSQALADQGYAVLRPNFRGSTISQDHLIAGFGQWGRKMQADLSAGVDYLVHEGTVDPARVCIVGASYGGYAALAAVTLEHGPYRCAASIAGIADMKAFLKDFKPFEEGKGDIRQRYLDRFVGVSGPDDPAVDEISPIRHVDALRVPVLLVHGSDDTVVRFEQSEALFDAARKLKKQVQLIRLPSEDHWLTRGETRRRMLQTTVDFLRKYNPPD